MYEVYAEGFVKDITDELIMMGPKSDKGQDIGGERERYYDG
jgi:hypothetical protein